MIIIQLKTCFLLNPCRCIIYNIVCTGFFILITKSFLKLILYGKKFKHYFVVSFDVKHMAQYYAIYILYISI